jgi:hypothetical protein
VGPITLVDEVKINAIFGLVSLIAFTKFTVTPWLVRGVFLRLEGLSLQDESLRRSLEQVF